MPLELENINISKPLNELVLFLNKLLTYKSKKDLVAGLLSSILNILEPVRFLSFVEKNDDELKVLYQIGDSKLVKDVFNEEMSHQIFNWVSLQRQTASLKLVDKEQFLFVPLIDSQGSNEINYGIVVIQLVRLDYLVNKDLMLILNAVSKVAALAMSKFLKSEKSEKYTELQDEIEKELKMASILQQTMSKSQLSKKIQCNILQDEKSVHNGNLWWISDLGEDITLVLIAQILSKGISSAMLSGYILGEMNSLKNRVELCLRPQEVLKYLNLQLNQIFKDTGITANAWYGVFNIAAKRVRFSNANHPEPYVIGPEQQVTNLVSSLKDKSLGVNIDSAYVETSSYVSGGSKLIICTSDLLEQAAKIGHNYDPSWLPQVLETLGSLSLTEMQKSLQSILSENQSGTATDTPRLAMLLEIPA